MPRLAACLAAAALLAAQTGCARYSENHRRGLLFLGGSATFIGAVIASDGAFCDRDAISDQCTDQSDDKALVDGTALLVAGLAVLGVAWFVHPQPAPAP